VDSAPYPPLELANRVGTLVEEDAIAEYERHGSLHRRDIVRILPDEWSFDGKRVLDFGCGAGRTLRHFTDEATRCEIWGCDIDEASIAWLKDNLSPPFQFVRGGEEPPLPFPAGHFDLIWAVSVFTHLADSWARWLCELHRLLRPGGLLLASFHGEGSAGLLNHQWPAAEWDEDRIGMTVLYRRQSWAAGGPFAYHSRWWLTEHWGRAFEVVELWPGAFASTNETGQGAVLLRRRDVEVTPRQLERPSDDPRERAARKFQRRRNKAERRRSRPVRLAGRVLRRVGLRR
jgi:SAM-dependent methyltransferase